MHAAFSQKRQEERVAELKAKIEVLQQQLGPGEDAEKIVKRHVHLLHRYNEAKDATQILIGRLAAIRQTTVRKIHEEYGLDTTE